MQPKQSFSSPQYVGFLPRLLAYLIDVIPIVALLLFIFVVFFGFDETIVRYRNRAPGDRQAILQYDSQRRMIRNLGFIVYILLSAILEATPWQGSLGKRLLGIRVTDENDHRLSFHKALIRNSSKPLSAFVLGLGFLWIIWSRRKQAWHDSIAHTLVTKRPKRKRLPKPPEPETFQI